MNRFMGFTRRNILIYFKDKSSIIFSMITPIIVFLLYVLFLKGTFVNGLNNAAAPIKDFIKAGDIDSLANGFLLAGILGSSLITVPYNCLITIVNDRERKVDYDILSTPLSRVEIILSYFAGAAACAFIMSAVILTVGLTALSLSGEMYLTGKVIAMLYLTALLGSLSSTAIFMIVVMFFKTNASVGAFMGIISAAAGFIIGAFIPLSEFSKGVQNFCFLFPATAVTILLRRNILSGVLSNIDTTLNGLDGGLFKQTVEEAFDFKFKFMGNLLSEAGTCYYILGVTLLAVIAIGVIYPKVYKRK
ncbi:MAG: ABC transporter permease [Lachnospiraceae bacterium]|nr:ABC transporter permease [Lachnospiraceae bacterium]MBO7600759.1 ABC transporter permease [Lachnospiraceae bacterium]